MFEIFRRAKATSAASGMLRSTLAPLTMFDRTIPETIYQDPYVLGYLSMIVAVGIDTESKGKLTPESKGRAFYAAFENVLGINGVPTARRALKFRETDNHQYLSGSRDASKMIAVMYGDIGPADDPDVAHAYKIAEQTSMSLPHERNTAAEAAGMMTYIKLVQYIDEFHRAQTD